MHCRAAQPHALFTGASSGIEEGCAAALLADAGGWSTPADALRAGIAKAGDAFGDVAERDAALPCDIGDERPVAALFDTLRQRFGGLDLL